VQAPQPDPTPNPNPNPNPNPGTGTGTGLRGEYFDNVDFTGLKVVRIDPVVNFNWGSGSPDPLIHPETFSVRWTGQVEAQHSEAYAFYVRADDGLRLWVNNQLIIDHWHDQSFRERRGSITLQAGQKYDIKLEYYERVDQAAVQLLWSSPSQAKQIIPQARLYAPASSQAPAPVVVAPSASPGLKAEYFNNLSMTGSPALTRVDSTINFDWALAAPAAGVNQDFAVRWTGQIAPRFSQTYTFHATTDDGVRLWIDGKLIINNWRNQSATEVTGTIFLQAGRTYDIRMEYYDIAANAVAKLSWSSASQIKEIVPASVLFQPLA
jgi:hypothetical protein